MLRCICPTGWNAGFHNWVMVGYGFELPEYCRRERLPGGLWCGLTLDLGLVTLLSIVIYLQAQAAQTPRDHCMVSEFVLVDWSPMNALERVNGGLSAFVIFTSPPCGGSSMDMFLLHVLDVRRKGGIARSHLALD